MSITTTATADDERWWSEVETAIEADGGEDGYFAHAPTVVAVTVSAGSGCRRRICAKRPALPSEVEAMPSKRRRPG